MRKLYCLLLFFLVFFFLPLYAENDSISQSGLHSLHILKEDKITPGGVLGMILHLPGPNRAVKALLLTDEASEKDTAILSAEGISLDGALKSNAGSSIWLCLMGLPSTMEPGTYRVSVTAGTDISPVTLSKDITVQSKEFALETISLNREMTTLRAKPDKRKRSESMELYNLYSGRGKEDLCFTETFSHPLDAFLWKSSLYGGRRKYNYSDGTYAFSVHTGVDYSAPVGTPVKSPGDGTVVLAKERMLTGNTVVIQHLPHVYSLYYHLDTLKVEEEQRIKRGDLIGTVGATGLVTGAHLHWELRVSGIAVDPEYFLEFPLVDKERILSIIR